MLPDPGPLGSAMPDGRAALDAQARLEKAGLLVPGDTIKAWDQEALVARVAATTPTSGRVLDMGCAYGPLLGNLRLLGFTDLWGVDIQPWDRTGHEHPDIRHVRADLLRTPFPDGSFDAVASVSVLEHGCPAGEYVAEAARLLRPGGVLLTSTDYWRWGLLSGLVPTSKTFDRPWTIQTPRRLRALRAEAARHGLEPTRDWDFAVREAPVHWNRRSYTFYAFELRKPGPRLQPGRPAA